MQYISFAMQHQPKQRNHGVPSSILFCWNVALGNPEEDTVLPAAKSLWCASMRRSEIRPGWPWEDTSAAGAARGSILKSSHPVLVLMVHHDHGGNGWQPEDAFLGCAGCDCPACLIPINPTRKGCGWNARMESPGSGIVCNKRRDEVQRGHLRTRDLVWTWRESLRLTSRYPGCLALQGHDWLSWTLPRSLWPLRATSKVKSTEFVLKPATQAARHFTSGMNIWWF